MISSESHVVTYECKLKITIEYILVNVGTLYKYLVFILYFSLWSDVHQVRGCQRDSKYPNNPDVQLECRSEEAIQVVWALYGRILPYSQMCDDYRNLYNEKTNCVSSTATQVAKASCDNKSHCLLAPVGSTFGNPCTYVLKYLVVAYECVNQ